MNKTLDKKISIISLIVFIIFTLGMWGYYLSWSKYQNLSINYYPDPHKPVQK